MIDIVGMQPVTILQPVLHAVAGGSVRSRKMKLEYEAAAQKGSLWRFGVPAHDHTGRDDRWRADDVQTAGRSFCEKVGLQSANFVAVKSPVSRGELLNRGRLRHGPTLPSTRRVRPASLSGAYSMYEGGGLYERRGCQNETRGCASPTAGKLVGVGGCSLAWPWLLWSVCSAALSGGACMTALLAPVRLAALRIACACWKET